MVSKDDWMKNVLDSVHLTRFCVGFAGPLQVPIWTAQEAADKVLIRDFPH